MLYLEAFYRASEVKYLTAVLMLRAMGCFETPEPEYTDTDDALESSTLRSFRGYGEQLSASCHLNAASCMVHRKSYLHVAKTIHAADHWSTHVNVDSSSTSIADIASLGPLELCKKALAASDSMVGRYRKIMVLKELRQ